MKDNSKKKTKILVGVLALFLVMAVGYALFTETLQINGTASANGNFALTYTCGTPIKTGTEVEADCSIPDPDKPNEIVTTSTFKKPTDGASYVITVTNTGSIPAVLTEVGSPNNGSFNDPSQSGDEGYIDMATMLAATYTIETVAGETIQGDAAVKNAKITLQPGESIKVNVSHSWLDSKDANVANQPALPEGGATINYNLTFKFQQEVA